MPNGFHHREELDVVTFAYTEQGYPEYRIAQTFEGIRVVHTLGHRGYQPIVEWNAWRDPEIPRQLSRERVEAIAGQYVTSLSTALANPNDSLDSTLRRASLAWLSFRHGWAILFGEYRLYGRIDDGPLVHVEPAWNAPDEVLQVPAEYREMILHSDIIVEGLSPMATIGGCVFEIAAYRELIVTTAPLPDIAAPSIDDDLFVGAMTNAMRAQAHRRERDQIAIRWRRPA